jgi:hypothetical protein
MERGSGPSRNASLFCGSPLAGDPRRAKSIVRKRAPEKSQEHRG